MSGEPEVSVEQVIKVTKDIVKDALTSGTLYDWTKGLLRVEIAKRLNIDVGIISSSNELKNAIREANEEAQIEYQESHPSSEFPLPEEDEVEVRPVKKSRKADKPAAKPKKRKSETGPASSSPPSKRKKTSQKTTQRSASIVTSSDDEDASKNNPSSSKAPASPKVPKSATRVADSDAEDTKTGKEQESDTELEDLIDDEPARPKKKAKDSKKAEKDASSKQRSRRKKEPEVETKDDKEIKRLKALISAAGFKRNYNKLFSTLPDPSSKRPQIKMLKDILTKECGFPSEGKRWTLKLAKELKEKREFEKELEDVQAFEKAITLRSGRVSRSSAMQQGSSVTDAMDEDEDEEVQPKKTVNAARKSIMAFLGDQSESE